MLDCPSPAGSRARREDGPAPARTHPWPETRTEPARMSSAFPPSTGARAALILVAALLAGLAFAAPARAAAGMEIGMEDERLLLRASSRAAEVVQAWKDLGIETVRVQAGGYSTGPAQRRLRRP